MLAHRGRSQIPLAVEQEPFLAVRSLPFGLPNGYVIQPHSHDWHQLLYASAGAMTVHAGQASWMIPSERCVWIPAGCLHSIRTWGSVEMRTLYFEPTRLAVSPKQDCQVLSVSPLLRELILRTVEMGALDSRQTPHQLLFGVLLEEIRMAPLLPLSLAMPSDERAANVAKYLIDDPTVEETIEQLGKRFGASSRTLERRFQTETGLSFGLWRQKSRMLNSLRSLSSEGSVTTAALDCGYSSVSAYIAAFKKTFGCTPSRFR